jgi:hypothetical protein
MSDWGAGYVQSVGYVRARGQIYLVISDFEISKPQAGYVRQRDRTCLVRIFFGNSRKIDYLMIWRIC